MGKIQVGLRYLIFLVALPFFAVAENAADLEMSRDVIDIVMPAEGKTMSREVISGQQLRLVFDLSTVNFIARKSDLLLSFGGEVAPRLVLTNFFGLEPAAKITNQG